MRRAVITASQEISFYHLTQTDHNRIECYLEFVHPENEDEIQQSVANQIKNNQTVKGGFITIEDIIF